ncbi:hypothetical protein JMN32_04135 [Fulvivirga sp. 29W222]|uniref:Uncharacterized protein n=1 Tax=Fulvivirga marina TaxID=2494733 RepID=A0A937FVT7_9BACT|nr:hypothetical protein [Fulvivirga marina]MBL6445482.1 hypothetical protein [Fulvivirga marina]
MKHHQNPMEHIAELLETKACIKQETYRNLQEVFKALMTEADNVINKINKKIKKKDKDVTLAVTNISDNEFHVKVAGDLLIFFMHTNIIMFDKKHSLNKSKYVADDPMRKYLGQINVYNFMADSLKYNRVNDPGYLISRLFVNCENHFLIEGDGQLNYMFEDISSQPITPIDISVFIQMVISQAIDSDLITSPFPAIRTITLNQKHEKSQALGGGYKIGFQMSYQQDIE